MDADADHTMVWAALREQIRPAYKADWTAACDHLALALLEVVGTHWDATSTPDVGPWDAATGLPGGHRALLTAALESVSAR